MSVSDVSNEMYVKICKKIAQLTKVIYTLNSKAEEHENIVQALKNEHDKNVERVMFESKNKIIKFKLQVQNLDEKEKEVKYLRELIEQIKTDNEKLQDALNHHLENTKLNEKQLQSDYENKFLVLQNKLLERKRDYTDLLDSFKTFKEEVENRKQEIISTLTKKHQEDLQRISQNHQVSLHVVNSEKMAHQQQMEQKASKYDALTRKWEDDKQELENDYETKISKLKTYYEKEMEVEHSKLKQDVEDKWTIEKTKITKEFQLEKGELSNRTRFLERKLEEYTQQSETSKTGLSSLESQLSEYRSRCITLEKTSENNILEIKELRIETSEKRKEIDTLVYQTKELQSKMELMKKDNLLKVTRKDNDYKNLESISETTKNELNESKTQIQRLQADVSKLKIDNTNLIKKFNNMMKQKEEEEKLYTKAQTTLKEKGVEIKKLQMQLMQLQEKQSLDGNALEKHYFYELKNEKEKYTENIAKFKEESEKILKDSQQKLLNEMEKQKSEYMDKQKILIATKDETVSSLESRITSIKGELCSCMDKLQEYKACLLKSNESYDLLQRQLDDKGSNVKTTQNKIESLERTIAELKVNATEEKTKLIEEKERLQKDFEKKWNEKLRTSEERLSTEKENMLNVMKGQYETEISRLTSLKDGKIEILKNEISILNNDILKLVKELSAAKKGRNDIAEEIRESFEKEKQKLMLSYSKEIEDLKTNLQKGNQHEIENLLAKQQNTIKSLRSTHEQTLDHMRKEHTMLLNTVRSQLVEEKEDNTRKLKEDYDSEKERLQGFLNMQSQERIKQLMKDFEQQRSDLKLELDRSRELRQKEFSVHTTKISDLLNKLEEEKNSNMNVNQTVTELEIEIRTLRQELEQKVEEILEVRRECNSRMRLHTDDLVHEQRRELHAMKADHLKEQQQLLHEAHEKYALFEEQNNALKLMLDETEDRYRNRPSRDEDIRLIKNLQQRTFEQEVECQQLSEERKLYRLELVNREENFNKVFKSTPNVGFMNPIEISKRKSARKK